MSKVFFQSSASFVENPLQRVIKFVLTDFKPNKNKEVIPPEEAENIIKTAVFSPVKINFRGNKPSGHAFAEPIGVITSAELQDGIVVATAKIWESENPEITDWIESAVKEGNPVLFSWEVFYDAAKSAIEEGVKVLRNVIVSGVSIVENAAYGSRTRLLSFSEEKGDVMENKQEEFGPKESAQDETVTVDNSLMEELETLRSFKKSVEDMLDKYRLFEQRKLFFPFDVEEYFDLVVSLDKEMFELLVSMVNKLVNTAVTPSSAEQKDEKPAVERMNVPNFVAESFNFKPEDLARAFRNYKKKV